MRGTRAKRLRRENPMRPNPGRLNGGTPKMMRHLKVPTIRRTGRRLTDGQVQ